MRQPFEIRIQWSLMLMVLFGCSAAGAGDGKGEGRLLAGFGAEGETLRWDTVNDNVMGGRSKGGFEVEAGKLVFSGATNTDGGGFSSIRSRPQALRLEAYAGIHLRVRGDGRTYTVRLATDDTRAAWWADFRTQANEWQEVKLPFDSFRAQWRGRKLDLPPPDPAKIVSVGLMIYDKRDGAFRLEVDWIRAHEPFSLDRLKWKRRPLVVFAARADDKSLEKQLAAVRESAAGFAERDMELVVAAPGHALSVREQAELRRRLAVDAGGFAVLLVGKDGTVKRRASRPLAMQELFALIDAMPMRRAEMEEREK